MKKIKMPAFSLAEALITLLIVCLITLASIPILTKKKRTANNGVHGTWMCTWNSERELVHWSSSEPKGDVNKPDTWAKGCNFVPPVNASLFNITAIGAGGKGGDGKTKLDLKAEGRTNTDFKPYFNGGSGMYRILVVGGGGGGGQGMWRSESQERCDRGSCGTGGGGASGAYFLADLFLDGRDPNTLYKLKMGAGGDQAKCTFNKSKRPQTERGGTGGTSKFYLYRNEGFDPEPGGNDAIWWEGPESAGGLVIAAAGGQGGERIATEGVGCCADVCSYGAGGVARDMPDINDGRILAKGPGVSGQFGGPGVVYNSYGTPIANNYGMYGMDRDGSLGNARGGAGFNALPFRIPNHSGAGAGGYGSRPLIYEKVEKKMDKDATYCHAADRGTDGVVEVYKILRMQGQGGGAAKPEERLSMTIKGNIDIQVGNIYSDKALEVQTNGQFDAGKYEDLRTTRVIIYDKNGRETKRIVGYPGKDGDTFEGTEAQQGFASYLTQKGGGKPSTVSSCHAVTKDITSGDTIETYPVCKKIGCRIEIPEDQGNSNNIDGYTLGEGKKGTKTAVFSIDKIIEKSSLTTSSLGVVSNYLDSISYDYFRANYYKADGTGLDTDKLFEKIKVNGENVYKNFSGSAEYLKDYYNYDKNIDGYTKLESDDTLCFSDNKLKYTKECLDKPSSDGKPNLYTIVKKGTYIGTEHTFECSDGGNADRRAFGAGGGGGFAHEKPGVETKGGMGAPGAVIIEW